MPYSFVWLHLIKCVLTCSIFVDSNTKRFLSVLGFFGKYFVLQKLKISKIVLPCFGDLVAGHSSRMPQSRARRSVLATCSWVEGPVARDTQKFSQLSSRLSREWDFQLRKILRNFFKTFGLTCFGGWNWRLTSITKIAWFAKGSSFSNSVLKKGLNLFFLHPVAVHFPVSLSIFQHHRGKLQNLPLFCHNFLNLQGNVWVLFSTLPFSQL